MQQKSYRCWLRTLFVLAMVSCSTGCAAGSGTLRFKKLSYPVSMSPVLEDDSGKLLGTYDLEKRGKFKKEVTFTNLIWGLVPTTGSVDLSAEINKKIRGVKGEGIINFSVTAIPCGSNFIFQLIIIPFWPGCTRVVVEGTIVRRYLDNFKATRKATRTEGEIEGVQVYKPR